MTSQPVATGNTAAKAVPIKRDKKIQNRLFLKIPVFFFGFQIFGKSYIIMRPKGAENFDFLGQKWRKYIMEKCWKKTLKNTLLFENTLLCRPAGPFARRFRMQNTQCSVSALTPLVHWIFGRNTFISQNKTYIFFCIRRSLNWHAKNSFIFIGDDARKVGNPLRANLLRANGSKIDICGAGYRDISSFCIRIVTVWYKKYSGVVRECFWWLGGCSQNPLHHWLVRIRQLDSEMVGTADDWGPFIEWVKHNCGDDVRRFS